MEEKRYRSGYERYQDVAEMIKQQCSQLQGKSVKRRNDDKTLYLWNGYKVFVDDMGIEIYDKEENVFLAVYNSNMAKECQFGLENFPFSGAYYPKLSDSFVTSQYQRIQSKKSEYTGKLESINLPADNIEIIVQDEIEKAQAATFRDDYSTEMNKKYVDALQKASEFFRNIHELAKTQ